MPTLLLTRPADASQRFAALMRDRLGEIDVVISPLIGIEIVAAPPDVAPDEGYVLTSEHAVAAILHHDLPRRSAWAVGDRTAKAAMDAGMAVRSAGGDAAALIDTILAENESGPLLHLHGEHTRGDVAARLTAAGVPTRAVVAYRQPEAGLTDAARALTGVVVTPVFSPRTASLLVRQWPGIAPLFVAAMSDAVAEAMREMRPAAMIVARSPDAQAMADAVTELWQKAQALEAQAGGA